MRVVFLAIAILTSALHSGCAGSESLSSAAFEYDRGVISYLEKEQVYAAWNPNDPLRVLSPGFKVMFFGSARGCRDHASGGPVSSKGNPFFAHANALTGVAHKPKFHRKLWTPSANFEDCDPSVRDEVGDSFVMIDQEPQSGGVGLFTFTGPDAGRDSEFFQPFGNQGKHRTGVNANIEATFTAFRFDWKNGPAVRPWLNDSDPESANVALIGTDQTVATMSVDESPTIGEIVQAQQELIITVINPHCIKTLGARSGACAFQYVFNIAVFRSGVVDWEKEAWLATGLFFDPAQGGIPVIHGPIGAAGDISVDAASGLDLYSSAGAPTGHELFASRQFKVRITFDQLKNGLKLIAGRKRGKPPEEVSSAILETYFGTNWSRPSHWVLATINVGQEVYNPSRKLRAFIGGSYDHISVRSVKP